MFRVVFVCSGNICRSPTAEVVFRAKIKEAGLEAWIEADSCGTSDWHIGDPPDLRAQKTLLKHGIDMSALQGRQLSENDFRDFDLLLAMDHSHYKKMKARAPEGLEDRVRMFLERGSLDGRTEVPDPYYGDMRDYNLAYSLIEPACSAWLDYIKTHKINI